MKTNQQISETFVAYDENDATISGLTFSGSAYLNGALQANPVTITESVPAIYKMEFTPTVTGSWFVNMESISGIYQGYYDVYDNNIDTVSQSVWNEVLTSFTGSFTSSATGQAGTILNQLHQGTFGTWELVSDQLIMYNFDGSVLATFNTFDVNNNPSITGTVRRERA